MSERKYFFLSGLSRSGSTLLGSLLNQNPEFYVSPTSPLMDMYCIMGESLQKFKSNYTYDYDAVDTNLQEKLIDNFYENRREKYIIDKHRGWPRNVNNVRKFIGEPKIVCTYRPVEEVIVSFIKLCDKDPQNVVDNNLKQHGKPITNDNRAKWLWETLVYEVYDSFRYGLMNHRECIHVCHYNELVENPQSILNQIYSFLETKPFSHDFENIVNSCAEAKDDFWGFSGLHDVRSEVKKESPDVKDYLSEDAISYFQTYTTIIEKYIYNHE